MTINRRSTLLAMSVVAVVTWGSGATLEAQDSLTRAKAFYASAAYEDALQVLGGLGGNISANEATEAAAYQVFCLVALGRADEARHASEAIVRSNPLYRPSADQVSPRIRTFFEDVRRPLLPDVTKASYAKAKDAFDRKDMAAAKADFDRVIALTDELAASVGRTARYTAPEPLAAASGRVTSGPPGSGRNRANHRRPSPRWQRRCQKGHRATPRRSPRWRWPFSAARSRAARRLSCSASICSRAPLSSAPPKRGTWASARPR